MLLLLLSFLGWLFSVEMIGAAVGQAIRFSLFIFGANNQKAAIMKRQFQFRLLLMALERKSLQQVELGISNFLELVGRCSEILSGDTHNVINIYFFLIGSTEMIKSLMSSSGCKKTQSIVHLLCTATQFIDHFQLKYYWANAATILSLFEFTDFTRDRGFNK